MAAAGKDAPIGFAEILPSNLMAVAGRTESIIESFRAGATVRKVTREWHLEAPIESNGLWFGRIGFLSEQDNTDWDDKENVFFNDLIRIGKTVPFAFDPVTMIVAFQARPGVIDSVTFVRTLEQLLNDPDKDLKWSVYQMSRDLNFESWVESMDYVLEVDFTLFPPNPHYGQAKAIEGMLEPTNAKSAEIRLRAKDDAKGLATESEFIAEGVAYSEKYGRLGARGVRDQVRSFWSSATRLMSIELRKPVDPETGEVRQESLAEAIEEIQSKTDQR